MDSQDLGENLSLMLASFTFDDAEALTPVSGVTEHFNKKRSSQLLDPSTMKRRCTHGQSDSCLLLQRREQLFPWTQEGC
jgi:hypothetical protein